MRVYHCTTSTTTVEEGSSGCKSNNYNNDEDQERMRCGDVGVREEIGVRLMVTRIEFWLYFFVYLFGVTVGLVFLNNLGQIAE